MKKICILTTSYPKWTERPNEFIQGKFVHDMAKSLVGAGCEVHVVTQHGEATPGIEVRDGVHVHRFHYFLHQYETLTKGAGVPENIKKVRNLLLVPFFFGALYVRAFKVTLKFGLDTINAHWGFPTAFIGVLLKLVTGRKLVTTLYGAELFPVTAGKMGYLRGFLSFAIKSSDLVAGISLATVEAATQISGRRDIHVIPDGIDIDNYHPGNPNPELSRKYKLLSGKTVFFTGRMVERKGHFWLLKGFHQVLSDVPDARLILGGDGPMRGEIEAYVRNNQLESSVFLLGFLPEEDLVPILQNIDVYVLPSCVDKNGDTEGSATAALEALACGCLVLVSRVGGNIGSIDGCPVAEYFAPSDPNDLAEKLKEQLLGGGRTESRTSSAREYIIRKYSWPHIVSEYLNRAKALGK